MTHRLDDHSVIIRLISFMWSTSSNLSRSTSPGGEIVLLYCDKVHCEIDGVGNVSDLVNSIDFRSNGFNQISIRLIPIKLILIQISEVDVNLTSYLTVPNAGHWTSVLNHPPNGVHRSTDQPECSSAEFGRTVLRDVRPGPGAAGIRRQLHKGQGANELQPEHQSTDAEPVQLQTEVQQR